MNDFDPVRAQHEIVLGLADIHKTLHTHARDSERQMAEAEAQHNAAMKMEAFAKDLLDREAATLRRLQDAAEAETKKGGD
jgi:hypothetical protein